jgi:hypothetical protein
MNPLVDRRSRDKIRKEINAGLTRAFSDWPEGGPANGPAKALIEIFAEYCEMIVTRLNKAPDHRRLAFLDSIGVSRRPPQPARVPLQVTLVPGSVTAAVVPAGTQVASAPSPSQPVPAIFETEHELVVTAAVADRIFVRNPAGDAYRDLFSLLAANDLAPSRVFTGGQPIAHEFYIGHNAFFGQQTLDSLTLAFDVEPGTYRGQQSLTWEIWDGAGFTAMQPIKDGTAGLTRSGEVEFENVPVIAESAMDLRRNRWMRCRLNPPLVRDTVLRSLTLERAASDKGLAPETALGNNSALDLSKDFLPFGARPQFGDVLYLTNARAFSLNGAVITLRIDLTNPDGADSKSGLPRVSESGLPQVFAQHARVAWEYWDGSLWKVFGIGKSEGAEPVTETQFFDQTRALTRSGVVTFQIQGDMQPAAVAGKKSWWIRARLIGGNYGEDSSYVARRSESGVDEYVVQPSTLAPPVVQRIQIDYSLHESLQKPEALLTCNDFTWRDETGNMYAEQTACTVFRSSPDQSPALYLGILPPTGLGMPTLPSTIYFVFGASGTVGSVGDDPRSPAVTWQCWTGNGWQRFAVADGTGAFTFSGAITFIAPPNVQKKVEFGVERYWLRAVWGIGEDRTSPLQRILPNAVAAVEGLTMKEVLGSGSGLPDQTFRTSRTPVLENERLDVQEEGAWQTWTSVPDFLSSDPRSQHYVINHVSGEVLFGNGKLGKKPPAGSAIQIGYRSGGGSAGNRKYDTIVQLKTTVPYVNTVTNPVPAEGGADAEPMETLLQRAPAVLRHGFRAVTKEDYEDLALAASPGVARALCVPMANPELDPGAKISRPGTVSLILVPVSTERQPQPTIELLNRLREFIEGRQTAGVELVLRGPEYVEIGVDLELSVSSLDRVSSLDLEIRNSLNRFLHPLHGGFDGMGWDFGRAPHRSDLMSLLQSAPGVDHVRRLVVTASASQSGHFLGCAGDIQVSFSLE